jgi:hypothetical protein
VTPLAVAKRWCANYQQDGSCLGACFSKDLTHQSVRPLPRCLMADPIRRCRYFEEVILPIKLEHPNRNVQERLRAEFTDALYQYRMAADRSRKIVRACRDCRKRDTGGRGRHFCEQCRIKRRRQSYRESKRRSRDTNCPHSTVVSG